jgi:hypothetical protein
MAHGMDLIRIAVALSNAVLYDDYLWRVASRRVAEFGTKVLGR